MRQLSALATFSNCVLQFEIPVRTPEEETVPTQKISVLVSHTRSWVLQLICVTKTKSNSPKNQRLLFLIKSIYTDTLTTNTKSA